MEHVIIGYVTAFFNYLVQEVFELFAGYSNTMARQLFLKW